MVCRRPGPLGRGVERQRPVVRGRGRGTPEVAGPVRSTVSDRDHGSPQLPSASWALIETTCVPSLRRSRAACGIVASMLATGGRVDGHRRSVPTAAPPSMRYSAGRDVGIAGAGVVGRGGDIHARWCVVVDPVGVSSGADRSFGPPGSAAVTSTELNGPQLPGGSCHARRGRAAGGERGIAMRPLAWLGDRTNRSSRSWRSARRRGRRKYSAAWHVAAAWTFVVDGPVRVAGGHGDGARHRSDGVARPQPCR